MECPITRRRKDPSPVVPNPEDVKGKKKPKQQEGTKKGEDKDGAKKGKKKKRKDSPKWMQVPPTATNKDKLKTVNSKQYYWCAKHAKWAGHIMSACKGKGLKDPKSNQQEPPPSPQTTAHLRLTRALSTLTPTANDGSAQGVPYHLG